MCVYGSLVVIQLNHLGWKEMSEITVNIIEENWDKMKKLWNQLINNWEAEYW